MEAKQLILDLPSVLRSLSGNSALYHHRYGTYSNVVQTRRTVICSLHCAFACCPGADSTIADCDYLLTDTISWDVDNDLTDQRDALIEFYNATGGEYWTSLVLSSSLRDSISEFDEYLIELGELTSESGFDISYLTTDEQEVVEAADALSANCSVQRTLQLINLLVKYPWNTASEFVKSGCSISALAIACFCRVCISTSYAQVRPPATAGSLSVTRHSCKFASKQQCITGNGLLCTRDHIHRDFASSRSQIFLSDMVASLDACVQACYHSPTDL